jgi:tetratricopeptide (TPR) repeat protein
MLRPVGGVRYEVEGQTLTVSIDKEWRFGHTSHLSGKVIERRVDGAVLAPKPLDLYDRGTWDPKEEFVDILEDSDPEDVPAWLVDVLDAGLRREYEMEQVIPGTDFSQSDYDPITEAVDRRDYGDLDGAFYLLQECIERDLRCIDAHVHLGNFRAGDLRSEWPLKEAVESYKAAVAVADRTVPPGFDGLLPWAYVDNRPLHRVLHGLGLCQWRLGDTAAARETVRRLVSLDPRDPFDGRLLLSRMESGLSYLQFLEESER